MKISATDVFEQYSNYYSSQGKNLMDEFEFVAALQEFIEKNNYRKIENGKDNKEV